MELVYQCSGRGRCCQQSCRHVCNWHVLLAFFTVFGMSVSCVDGMHIHPCLQALAWGTSFSAINEHNL